MTTATLQLRFLLVALAATAMLSVGAAEAAAAQGQPTAEAASQYRLCKKKLSRNGHRYKVSRRGMPCGAALRKSGRVLKTKHASRGWHCSLPNLPQVGSCWKGKRGKRAFVFRRIS